MNPFKQGSKEYAFYEKASPAQKRLIDERIAGAQKAQSKGSGASLAALLAGGHALAGGAESLPASGLVTSEAQNALWNAPASAATAGESGWSLANIGAEGNYLLPVAGAIGAYDLLSNKKHGAKGAAQGALSGAAIGSYGGLPGAAIGALIGGGVGYFGNFGDKDRFKDEWNRKKKLVEQGILPESELGPEPLRGRSDAELLAEAKASGGPTKFAETRDEKFLTPDEILGFSFLPEKFGKEFVGATPAQKKAIGQYLLDAQAVREHHGQLDFNDKLTPELESKIKDTLTGKLEVPKGETAVENKVGLSSLLSDADVGLDEYKAAIRDASKKEKAKKIASMSSVSPSARNQAVLLRNEYL